MPQSPWIALSTAATGWEADLTVARLSAAEIPARSRGNDLVGLFGPGFQGASARGFVVEVPQAYLEEARRLMSEDVSEPVADGEQDDGWDEP